MSALLLSTHITQIDSALYKFTIDIYIDGSDKRRVCNLSCKLLQANTFRQRRVLPHGNLDLSDVSVEVLGAAVERRHQLAQWVQRHGECTTDGLCREPPHRLGQHRPTVQQTVPTSTTTTTTIIIIIIIVIIIIIIKFLTPSCNIVLYSII